MSWNFRVIKHKTAPTGNTALDRVTPKEWYGLHEVYYNDKGEIDGWIEEPEVTGETLEDLRGTIDLMWEAAHGATPYGKKRRILNEEELCTTTELNHLKQREKR